MKKLNYLGIIAIMAVVIAVLSINFNVTATRTAQKDIHSTTNAVPQIVNPNQTCYDSDGFDPYTYGHVSVTYHGNSSGGAGSWYDSCTYNNQYVKEHVCNGTEHAAIEYYCENGCYGGRCLNYSIPEPYMGLEIRAYKYQYMDNPEWNHIWGRTEANLYGYDGDGEIDMWLDCWANDQGWSSNFNNWVSEEEFEDTNSNGGLNLYLQSIEENDFEDLYCYGEIEYGPYELDEQISSGDIYFPHFDTLMIAMEPTTGWNVYLVAHTQGEIESGYVEVDIKYSNGTEDEFEIELDYNSGTSYVNEMIPINLSDNWDEIDIHTNLRDYDPYYVRTSAWKEYEAGSKGKTIELNGKEFTVYEGTSKKITERKAIKLVGMQEREEILKNK